MFGIFFRVYASKGLGFFWVEGYYGVRVLGLGFGGIRRAGVQGVVGLKVFYGSEFLLGFRVWGLGYH